MEIKQIEVGKLKSNPYKKEINSGEINKEHLEKIKSNIKELGFMGVFTVVKIKDSYHLVFGHHRQQAVKEVFGKDFKVNIEVKDYNDDKLLRGMVVENLTQRAGDFREETTNVVAIETYLNTHPEIISVRLNKIRTDGKGGSLMQEKYKNKVVSSDIANWLNKEGIVMDQQKINDLLGIYHNLHPDLQKEVQKTHDQPKEVREDILNFSQGLMLSKIEDKNEQKDLAKVLKKTRETRVRNQSELITEYKKSPIEVKEKIRKGRVDLADVHFENIKSKAGLKDINTYRDKISMEKHIEIREYLKKIHDIINGKPFLDKSNNSDLENTYHYIFNFMKKDLAPFMKEIEKILFSRRGNKSKNKITYFELPERR